MSRLAAVEKAFRGHVDYAQLVKLYGDTYEEQKRYSPAKCIGCERHVIDGDPDLDRSVPVMRKGRILDADVNAPLHSAHKRILKED